MDGGEGGEEEEEEGKISPMCESIGHRPLRGRCPKVRFLNLDGVDKKSISCKEISLEFSWEAKNSEP